MSKFDPYSLSPGERNKILDDFYSMVTSLRNRKQVINFFKDLLTPSEAVMLARRIQIAKMLLQGYNYLEISNKLKTGIDTITRVQRWLKDGFGDYMKSLDKIIKREESRKEAEAMREADPHSLQGLACRYPLYFGLTYELYKMLKGSEYGKEKRGRKEGKKR